MNRALLSLLALSCALSACTRGDVRETLGIKKKAPDEFMVMARPQLEVPSDFTLVSPKQQSEIAHEEVRDMARRTLLKNDNLGNKEKGLDDADTVLLKKAKAKDGTKNIRAVIAEENKNKDESPLQSLVRDNGDPIVEADKEEARIKDNLEKGKPVTEGETAKKKQHSGLIEILE